MSFVAPEPSVASSLPPSPVLPGCMERSLSIAQNQAHSRDSGEEENQEGRTSPCLRFSNNTPRIKEASSSDVVSGSH